MRLVFATAELSPVATVGGLAAASAGLVSELRRQGVDVDVVMPDYGGIALADPVSFDLDVPSWAGPASVTVGDHPVCGRLHLVDVPGMARPHPYLQPSGEGWPDNDARFFAFARAVAAFVERVRPDVVHLNDWHTGAALAALTDGPPSVLSIHNLAYQGHASVGWLDVLGPRAQHYEWWGGTNSLSGAIALADAVVAVSPNYVHEILTPAGGFGLHDALTQRGAALRGILNGIDTEVWDPAADPHLASPFDLDRIDARRANRSALLDRLEFPDDVVPLAAVVTRLTPQKGIDLLEPLIPVLDELPVRLALLGSGDADLAGRLHVAASNHSASFAFIEGYDETLSHLMFAGSDLFVMPSRFEPCGLTQMQAMRYGSIPVVTAVGGLVDTVPDVDAHPRSGRGIVARRAESVDLLAALFRASRRLGDRRRRATIQRRGMAVDWSWKQPAREYLGLYRELVAHG
ncbi:MAG: glycosyltransferase [Ilumatobacter sp.]|nr:MAG: glycosyltransferase [Ilumatobacter sp.]